MLAGLVFFLSQWQTIAQHVPLMAFVPLFSLLCFRL
jgi:hypothetical protein